MVQTQKRPIHNRPILKILVAEKSSFSQRGLEAISQLGQAELFNLTQEELITNVHSYHILIVRLGLQVNEKVLNSGKDLLVIATPTTGLDHIDTKLANQLGIAVLSIKGEQQFLENVYATAEHTFALLLSLIRHVPASFDSVKVHHWRRDTFRGNELHGKVLGIVGCGRLGRMVARYGLAFGMELIAFDPYLHQLPKGINQVNTLAELLEKSDVVTIHVPLNEETQEMFSENEFSTLKPGSWLINTSRGTVIDEGALLEALKSGQLAGAALDVIQNEHLLVQQKSHPLVKYASCHDNLIITPHIGGATYESVEKADLFLVNKIASFLAN